MIDTDEYKGQTEGEWEIWGDHIIGPLQRGSHKIIANFPEQGKPDGWWGDLLPEMEANMKLMADSPLLLAEVKRLRKKIQLLHDTWFADAEMASDVDERMTELLRYEGGEEE